MMWEGKRVLVVGLGESGKAAARYAAARGARVSATDRRSLNELGETAEEMGKLNVQLELGGHAEGIFLASDTCRACHPGPYESWRNSFHRTMTQAIEPNVVLGDFSTTPYSKRAAT